MPRWKGEGDRNVARLKQDAFTVELTKADKRMRAPMPANLQEIQYWIANIGNAGTAKTYLMGLKKAHELLGSEINTSSPMLIATLKGLEAAAPPMGRELVSRIEQPGRRPFCLATIGRRPTGRPQTGGDTDWGLQAGTASAALHSQVASAEVPWQYCGTKPAHDWIEEPLTSEINECLPSAVPWIRCMRDAFKRSAANHSSCDILRLGGPEEKLVGRPYARGLVKAVPTAEAARVSGRIGG
ncbi:hypothetical protein FOZ60_016467 [Perkinsus olseni]|uniref:Uncharacterized protein n=1 Tax=Perkinsus olseni TaxID=32597 RepID=A0A7J6P4C1_PEROL|nr:hypothetical protein FOZ60_016467 [Perkinsus olseni]